MTAETDWDTSTSSRQNNKNKSWRAFLFSLTGQNQHCWIVESDFTVSPTTKLYWGPAVWHWQSVAQGQPCKTSPYSTTPTDNCELHQSGCNGWCKLQQQLSWRMQSFLSPDQDHCVLRLHLFWLRSLTKAWNLFYIQVQLVSLSFVTRLDRNRKTENKLEVKHQWCNLLSFALYCQAQNKAADSE